VSPQAFWALLWGGAGQWREVRVDGATCWIPCERPRPLVRLLTARRDVQVSRPLSDAWVTQGNERLAHACQGRRSTADASALIASPFTGSAYIEYTADRISSARQIVGGLRDAPDKDAWRQAA
jgi:hypothetical protein